MALFDRFQVMTNSAPVKRKQASAVLFIALALCSLFTLTSCNGVLGGDEELTRKTYFELVDWHISGLWVINCPVCWVRVANYNDVPIKSITFQYNTFDEDNNPLDQGTYTIDQTVRARGIGNFAELYVGFVNLHCERLAVKLLSVKRG